MSGAILRQIRDIQVQAERLISERANLDSIEEFARYNEEIKQYLLQHVDDEMILQYVREIPDFDFEEGITTKKVDAGMFGAILTIASQGMSAYFHQRRAQQEALDLLRDVRGKYASIEFMCKNYFE